MECETAVIHGYSSVNPLVVWDSVWNDVPALRRQIAELIAGFNEERNIPDNQK